MSATAFLRHRRAAAAVLIAQAAKKAPKTVKAILADYDLTPADVANLSASNDALVIADRITALQLEEPELDSLEEVGAVELGDRAAVHSPDVRADQFEDKLQHPAAETVGVGNMHDGPEAAHDLANVGGFVLGLPGVDGDIAKGAAVEAAMRDDALARGTGGRVADVTAVDITTEKGVKEAIKVGEKVLKEEAKQLPEVYPSTEPAKDEQVAPAANESGNTTDPVTAEGLAESSAAAADGQPTDPEGTQEGVAATPVDTQEAVEAVEKQEAAAEATADIAIAALAEMDRDRLIGYAATNNIDLGEVKERTTPKQLRDRIAKELKKREEAAANG